MTVRLLVVSASAFLVFAIPGLVNGQRRTDLRVGLSELPVERSRHFSVAMLHLEPERSYWKEGGALTALAVVVAVNLWVRDVSTGQRVGGSLALGSVFFVPGALIGGLIRK